MTGTFFEYLGFYLTIGLFILTVLVFVDAIKSTVNYYIPNKENKIYIKFIIGIVLIVLSIILAGFTSPGTSDVPYPYPH